MKVLAGAVVAVTVVAVCVAAAGTVWAFPIGALLCVAVLLGETVSPPSHGTVSPSGPVFLPRGPTAGPLDRLGGRGSQTDIGRYGSDPAYPVQVTDTETVVRRNPVPATQHLT